MDEELARTALRVAGTVLVLLSARLTFLAGFRPAEFYRQYAGHSRRLGMNESKWSARFEGAMFIGAFCGYVLTFHLALAWCFGFLPAAWGSVDEDGDFLPLRDGLASVLAFCLAALIFQVLEHAGARLEKDELSRERLAEAKNQIKELKEESYVRSVEVSQEREALEAKLKLFTREKTKLERSVASLRKLVPPDILDEYDKQEQERANAPPRTYYS